MQASELINIVRLAKKNWLLDSPEIKQVLRNTKIGSPRGVFTPHGELSYWLVPLLVGRMACGFASIDTIGKILRLGLFGASLNEKEKWIDMNYFILPPKDQLDLLKQKYPGYSLSKPLFSYDTEPSRFAWLVKVISKKETLSYAFFLPGMWYEKKSLSSPKDIE